MGLIDELKDAIIEGDEIIVKDLAEKIVENDLDIQEAIFSGLMSGMKEVGRLYEEHEYFIPEIIISSDALSIAFDIFKPHLKDFVKDVKATVVIGVVKGDIHEIGKSIVSTFLTISGYNVIDLGRNVHSDKFLEQIEESRAEIVCLSTLMTPTLEEMRLMVNRLKERGLKDRVKVMIGGAPTDPDFMKEIGADFYCKDAIEAINTLDNYFSNKRG